MVPFHFVMAAFFLASPNPEADQQPCWRAYNEIAAMAGQEVDLGPTHRQPSTLARD